MKAVIYEAFNAPPQLKVVPDPNPETHGVVVKVMAMGGYPKLQQAISESIFRRQSYLPTTRTRQRFWMRAKSVLASPYR